MSSQWVPTVFVMLIPSARDAQYGIIKGFTLTAGVAGVDGGDDGIVEVNEDGTWSGPMMRVDPWPESMSLDDITWENKVIPVQDRDGELIGKAVEVWLEDGFIHASGTLVKEVL